MGDAAPQSAEEPAPTSPTRPGDAPPPLLVWALAAFHAALLVSVAVGVLFASDVLGEALAGLDTVVGVVAYLYLWAVTWWTNRRMLRGLQGDLLAGDPRTATVVAEAAKWGALAGVLVFLPVLVVAFVAFVGAGGLGSLPFLAVGGATGALLAAGVGAVLGVALATVDLLLLGAARSWVPGDAGPAEP